MTAFCNAMRCVVRAAYARLALQEQLIERMSPEIGRLYAAAMHEEDHRRGMRRMRSAARLALETWQAHVWHVATARSLNR